MSAGAERGGPPPTASSPSNERSAASSQRGSGRDVARDAERGAPPPTTSSHPEATSAPSFERQSDRANASVLRLARAIYREVPLYSPDVEPCALDLSDNTNLWGVPPAAERALRSVTADAITRYPALYGRGLDEAFADYLGVRPEQVVTGCGSDDVLDCAIRAFAEPGARLAMPDPSFSMIPTFARLNGLEPVLVPMEWRAASSGAEAGGRPDLTVDPERLVATGARIIYLCSPNNPTGTALDRAVIEHVVERAPGIVILDEAYAEFAGASHVDLLARGDRLLVTRTMSKAFGLAGLRVGYGAGSEALVREVRKSRGPYKVSGVAERAAGVALRDDLAWVRERAAEAVASRDRLAAALRATGCYRPLATAANFVTVMPDARFPGAAAIARYARARGVGIRAFDRLTTVGPALRIGAGPWEMMERALAALPTPEALA